MCVSSCSTPVEISEWGTGFRLIRNSSWSGNEEGKVCREVSATSPEMPFQSFPWAWNKTKVWFHWWDLKKRRRGKQPKNYKTKKCCAVSRTCWKPGCCQFTWQVCVVLNLSASSSLCRQVARCNSSNVPRRTFSTGCKILCLRLRHRNYRWRTRLHAFIIVSVDHCQCRLRSQADKTCRQTSQSSLSEY